MHTLKSLIVVTGLAFASPAVAQQTNTSAIALKDSLTKECASEVNLQNGWKQIIIPKGIDGFNNMIDSLNTILSDKVVKTMDIQFGEQKDCVPTVFMVSDVMSDTVLVNTGHMSCFNINLYAQDSTGKVIYFNSHIDAEITPQNDLTGKLKNALQNRMIILQQRVGAGANFFGTINCSNAKPSSAKDYQTNLMWVKNLYDDISKQTGDSISWEVGAGPNTAFLEFNEIFALGGPDATITTDIIIIPSQKLIIEHRPCNPVLFNQSFGVQNLPQMIEKYTRHFSQKGETQYRTK